MRGIATEGDIKLMLSSIKRVMRYIEQRQGSDWAT